MTEGEQRPDNRKRALHKNTLKNLLESVRPYNDIDTGISRKRLTMLHNIKYALLHSVIATSVNFPLVHNRLSFSVHTKYNCNITNGQNFVTFINISLY